MSYIKPGQAVAQLTVPAGWVVAAGAVAKHHGVPAFQALIDELQQDTDPKRIGAILRSIPRRSGEEQKLIATALALGANLVVLIDEWLHEAPDDPQVARRTPRGEN